MFSGFAVAGYTGPTIMKRVFDATNSFHGAFLVGIGFCLAGLLLAFLFRLLTRARSAHALACAQ